MIDGSLSSAGDVLPPKWTHILTSLDSKND